MASSGMAKRSRVRRAGESAFGMLLVVKMGLMALLTVLLLVAGVWTSWDSARLAMFGGDARRGTLTVASCGDERCSGVFRPTNSGGSREGVTLSSTVTDGDGQTLEVAVRPGTDTAVRTGPAGILYAWVPLAGALLLAALVVAGGLRMRRTAWGMGLLGGAVMVGAFVTL